MNDLIGFLYDAYAVLFAVFSIGLLVTVAVLGLRSVLKCILEEKRDR